MRIAYQDTSCASDEIYYEEVENEGEGISVYDAAEIYESHGRDEDYTFGCGVGELRGI